MSQATVSISIEGWDEKLKVNTLSLRQAYNRHHVFELVTPLPTDYKLTIESLKNILGEDAHISINTGSEDGSCYFTGFVDEVIPIWTGTKRALRIKGFSPTIFMDCTPRFRCFTDRTLGQILGKITGNYSKPSVINSNSTGKKVGFSIQSQETDYNFLCRLADEHGKLFFYDGKELHFGALEHTGKKIIPLDFKLETNHLELSMNLAPLRFKMNGYDLNANSTIRFPSTQQIATTHSIVGATMEKSGCYPTQEIHMNHLVNGTQELEAISQKITARQAHELVILSGTSNNPALKIGCHISVKKTEEIIGSGTYVVIEVNHQVSRDNSYQNSFTAVPAGYPFPIRMTQRRNPISGPMMAIVKETQDPDKLGRVKVEFIGDEEKSLSPWLRVLVPFTQHGGMYFPPEKEDKVIVFYEDFNAEKSPFVMGSFYHGGKTASKWEDSDNRKKGIALEKISFTFDDRTGKLIIEAEEIEMNAKKKMKFSGGNQITQEAKRIDLNP